MSIPSISYQHTCLIIVCSLRNWIYNAMNRSDQKVNSLMSLYPILTIHIIPLEDKRVKFTDFSCKCETHDSGNITARACFVVVVWQPLDLRRPVYCHLAYTITVPRINRITLGVWYCSTAATSTKMAARIITFHWIDLTIALNHTLGTCPITMCTSYGIVYNRQLSLGVYLRLVYNYIVIRLLQTWTYDHETIFDHCNTLYELNDTSYFTH